MLLLEGVRDVLEEDEAQDDVLVLGSIDVRPEDAGGLPQLGLVAEGGAVFFRFDPVSFSSLLPYRLPWFTTATHDVERHVAGPVVAADTPHASSEPIQVPRDMRDEQHSPGQHRLSIDDAAICHGSRRAGY
jgi:hypothetical protein